MDGLNIQTLVDLFDDLIWPRICFEHLLNSNLLTAENLHNRILSDIVATENKLHRSKYTPSQCPCGQEYSLAHLLHCPKGRYTILRHIEIKNIFAELMVDVGYDVQIEPNFQDLQVESVDTKPPVLKMKLD